MNYKIGVDGGGSKTECILVDEAGQIVARHHAPGCNPSIVGAETARAVVAGALRLLRKDLGAFVPQLTLLCMAGSPEFWRDQAPGLAEGGRAVAASDSAPVLELATAGRAGLALHAGTGSFVATRAPDGSEHYAGGLGWRFGDAGSGYDLGRRAISRTLLEQQGWAPASRLAAAVLDQMGESSGPKLMRGLYADPAPNARIAALAPAVLNLAAEGDEAARAAVLGSGSELIELACAMAARFFSPAPLSAVRAGVSGPILLHPAMQSVLAAKAPFVLKAVQDPPIEGVRRMLLRMA